jgi:hypothetical protein
LDLLESKEDAILTSIWERFLEENGVESKQMLFGYSALDHRSNNGKKKSFAYVSRSIYKNATKSVLFNHLDCLLISTTFD